MKTVNEVSKLTGVSVRTLHYYDEIGLLSPAVTTDNGYRLYDDKELERLQQILIYRELEIPLKEIKLILDSPSYERNRVLDHQIALLKLKKDHLQKLIDFATGIKTVGVDCLDFSVFDTKKVDDYEAQTKVLWGKSEAYREFEEKNEGLSETQKDEKSEGLMNIFVEFGQLLRQGKKAEDIVVQEQVKKLQEYITENFYKCNTQILKGLGQMYAGGGSFTENIDRAGGQGTAEFASKAIEVYCN